MSDYQELVNRYVALWNEPDAALRRKSIIELWAEDGANFTQSIEAVGYEALEARVTRAYEKFVRDAGFIFKLSGKVESHHNALRFTWEMVPAGGGAIAGTGLEFLILDEAGRIKSDYQFSQPSPSV